jgi:uncharacterized membrane protein
MHRGESTERKLSDQLRESPAVWTFAVAGLLCGIIYAFVVPPFAAPDEISHFLRAWYVSEGHLGAVRENGQIGVMVPSAVRSLGGSLPMHPIANPEAIRSALHAPPVQRDLVFAENALHAWASPVVYLPQAVGIAVGRWTGVSPLRCLYFGRVANVISGVMLIAFAISAFPSYRWLMTLIALTPMANHLRGSLSLDSTTMGIAFLFFALVTRVWFFQRDAIRWRTWIAITVLAGLLCLTRTTYLPVAVLPLFIAADRFRTVRTAWRARVMHVLVVPLAALSAVLTATRNWTPFRPGISDPQMQVRFILGHPIAFAKVLWLEHVIHAKWYLISMVGDLGAETWVVPLPKILVAAYFLAIVGLLIADTDERLTVSRRSRILLALISVASTVAISIAIYTVWNPVGWDRIDGLQGRYYLAFTPAAFFIVHRARRGMHQRLRMLLVIVAVCCANGVAVDRVIHAWYPGGWSGWRSMVTTTR